MDTIITCPRSEPEPMALVAEANHRIANSLTVLVSMVRLQAGAVAKSPRPLTNAEVRLTLEGIAARIGTISQLHRLLSHVPGDGTTALKSHLREAADMLVSALSSPEQPVIVAHAGSDFSIPVRHVQPVMLMLCEIFINALKYAHPTGVPLVMTVDCGIGPDGQAAIVISDDGVGLPEGFDPHASQGLGFRVLRSLAAEIGGKLDIVSTALGLTFRLTLPANAMAAIKLA